MPGVAHTSGRKRPNDIDVYVGSRVRMRRMMIGMSQEKLGDALGLTFQQVQKYEKGTNRISASKLQEISRILSVGIPYFFEGSPGETAVNRNKELKNGNSETMKMQTAMATGEGLALMQAFMRISDPKVRRSLAQHAEVLAKAFPDE